MEKVIPTNKADEAVLLNNSGGGGGSHSSSKASCFLFRLLALLHLYLYHRLWGSGKVSLELLYFLEGTTISHC